MTIEESKKTGQRLFKSRQYAEALPLLKLVAEALPEEEENWQEAVLAASWSGQHQSAVAIAKQAIRRHPRSDWLWRQLGSELTTLDRLDQAERALNNARSLNPDAEWLWRYHAALHKKRGHLEKEIEAWQNLYKLEAANAHDLNSLGIAYHDQKNFKKALEFYRRSAATEPSVAPLFNMGLVFNDPEMSQDADAADSYRRALALKPDYERARERLELTKRKLLPLAERARSAAVGLVQPDEFFRFYLSPFEVLKIEALESVEELDVKVIQRAKKRLLQEIDLNDGKVSWLDDYPLDKSRALTMEDELLHEGRRRFHWAVFRNKRLLRFLTRGGIGHFLYSDNYFPRDTLELLDEEPEFRAFLSKPFARQYNLVLTRAIERRLLPVVEVLFDGRRWVEPEDEDICFKDASKRIDDLVERMRSKAGDGRTRKVSLSEMEDFLREHSFPELFNLLPTAFASAQRELVEEIRSLAVSCFNEHGDSDLSKGVLSLCKRFTSRSVELTKRLEEDFTTIERMIAEDRKHSFSARVRRSLAVQIGKAGIAYGGASMTAAEIEGIRWGILVQTVNGVETEHSFSLVVRNARSSLSVQWNKRGMFAAAKALFRKPTEVVPIAELSIWEQEAYFQKMIDAAIHHLVPALIAKLVQRLQAGQPVVIGPCALSQHGISFRTGLIFRNDHLLPWGDVETRMGSGNISVFSRTNRKAQVSMAARDTDNAVVLPILCVAMREHTTSEQEQSPREVTERQRNQESSSKSGLRWLVFVAIAIILGIIYSLNAKKTAPSGGSYTPPSAPNPPAYTPPSAPATPASESKTVYRVDSFIKAELRRDGQVIDSEKAKAERMARQLESLGREIEQKRLYLDRASQSAVDEFNRKVDTYNGLLHRVRAQNRLVNELVESYNEKLHKHGR